MPPLRQLQHFPPSHFTFSLGSLPSLRTQTLETLGQANQRKRLLFSISAGFLFRSFLSFFFCVKQSLFNRWIIIIRFRPCFFLLSSINHHHHYYYRHGSRIRVKKEEDVSRAYLYSCIALASRTRPTTHPLAGEPR